MKWYHYIGLAVLALGLYIWFVDRTLLWRFLPGYIPPGEVGEGWGWGAGTKPRTPETAGPGWGDDWNT